MIGVLSEALVHMLAVLGALAQVRHSRGQNSAKSFKISSSHGRVYTTFAIAFEPIWKGQPELLK